MDVLVAGAHGQVGIQLTELLAESEQFRELDADPSVSASNEYVHRPLVCRDRAKEP